MKQRKLATPEKSAGAQHPKSPDVPRGLPIKSPQSQERKIEAKQSMQTKHSRIIETVSDGMVAAIKGTGNILQATVDSISQALVTTLKGTGKVGTAATDIVADVASGAIRGAAQVGLTAVETVRKAVTKSPQGVKPEPAVSNC